MPLYRGSTGHRCTYQSDRSDQVFQNVPQGEDQSTILQLFIEPKGDQLRPKDDWKQAFMVDIDGQARLETVFQGRDYVVFGLPFFNEEGKTNIDFKAAFEDGFLPV